MDDVIRLIDLFLSYDPSDTFDAAVCFVDYFSLVWRLCGAYSEFLRLGGWYEEDRV